MLSYLFCSQIKNTQITQKAKSSSIMVKYYPSQMFINFINPFHVNNLFCSFSEPFLKRKNR